MLPDGRFYTLTVEQTLYNNELQESAASLRASRLVAQSHRLFTYLICGNDHSAPSQYQEMLAASANAQVEKRSSGHLSHLSQAGMFVHDHREGVEETNRGASLLELQAELQLAQFILGLKPP